MSSQFDHATITFLLHADDLDIVLDLRAKGIIDQVSCFRQPDIVHVAITFPNHASTVRSITHAFRETKNTLDECVNIGLAQGWRSPVIHRYEVRAALCEGLIQYLTVFAHLDIDEEKR